MYDFKNFDPFSGTIPPFPGTAGRRPRPSRDIEDVEYTEIPGDTDKSGRQSAPDRTIAALEAAIENIKDLKDPPVSIVLSFTCLFVKGAEWAYRHPVTAYRNEYDRSIDIDSFIKSEFLDTQGPDVPERDLKIKLFITVTFCHGISWADRHPLSR